MPSVDLTVDELMVVKAALTDYQTALESSPSKSHSDMAGVQAEADTILAVLDKVDAAMPKGGRKSRKTRKTRKVRKH